MKSLLNFLEQNYKLCAAFTIFGQPYSLKNRQIISCRGKYPRIIKSKEASNYLKNFSTLVPAEFKTLSLGSVSDPLAMIVVIYYKSRRNDLDVHAIMDGLQAAEVVANDRYIREIHSFAFQDKENPRAEIYLFKINSTKVQHPVMEENYGTL